MELEGILQTFNTKNSGRIYSQSVYDITFRDLEISLRAKTRRDKIKKMFNEN